MTLDPRFKRFLRISRLDRWFTGEYLLHLQASFLAALFAEKCGAKFKDKPLGAK